MEQLLLLVAVALSFIVISADDWNKQPKYLSVEDVIIASGILEEFLENLTVTKCHSPFLCWPGKCFVVEQQQFCLCPEGLIFDSGRCIIGNRRNCERNLSCYPGQCSRRDGRESCLCPEGFYSDRGMCNELIWNCRFVDCKPGKCIKEFNKEKCLCPEGYAAKAGKCIEIAYTNAKQISTIMLMIIVSIASVMLTTFFGVCICYYTSRSNM